MLLDKIKDGGSWPIRKPVGKLEEFFRRVLCYDSPKYKTISQYKLLDLDFSDPHNDKEICLIFGKIRGDKKVVEVIEDAFLNGKLSLSVFTPESFNPTGYCGNNALDPEALKLAAKEAIEKVKEGRHTVWSPTEKRVVWQ